ncbi:uncharacterized protein MONOS_15353 [Monocercomonoides exilis]|uniref:uncharacterized protein n=1 Tax=Monocercomonoides exilis TaxID=2049356 RepID=UPI003559AD6D|nr:hypothetical protein MONOS_15353 [Monocercomonoides exilis]|eukprot:MONOS_15353.1-p1 / transcript=MONOS_15353.1 / gene=MONOS_15353 / organism=Monocercomonoides_exilis_PA203 / gene_product=unspecified product / transcript_product=unspecified product / location=Mono_scaffold01207:3483-7365(+) / protein_length=1223 / sequence_SO=supercontig / SO=protein_coding / is_pseudo=false
MFRNIIKLINFVQENAKCKKIFIGTEECILKTESLTEINFFGIVVPSSFKRTISAVIESSTRNGELHMSNCAMSVIEGKQNTIGFFLIKSMGKMVELDSVTISDAKSSVSLFSFSLSSANMNEQEYKVKLLNCTLEGLEIDSGVAVEGKAAVFEGNVGVEMMMNGSKIEGALSKKSKKGGAMKIALSEGGFMTLENSSFIGCICENMSEGGKGGGIYLDCSSNEGGFHLSSISFSGCSATVGKNMFVKSGNLVNSVKTERFAFDCTEYKDDGNAFVGKEGIYEEMDLRVFLSKLKWVEVSVSKDGHDTLGCGSDEFPCYSIEHGIAHLTSDFISQMFIVEVGVIEGEINLKEMNLSLKNRDKCKVEVKSGIEKTREALITTIGTVSLVRVKFVFDSNFASVHESLTSPEGGILEIINCSFDSKQSAGEGSIKLANIPFYIINTAEGELQLMECTMSNLILQKSALYLLSSLPSVMDSLTICNSTVSKSLMDINECGQLNMKKFHSENITVEGNEESLISCLSMKKTIQLANCTIGGVSSKTTKGKLMKLENCTDVKMDSCIFDGNSKERNEQTFNEEEEICRWDGSLVDIVNSSVMMKDTTLSNSLEGGITMSGGNVIIEKGEFMNNNPSIEGYPSMRRNIICSDSGTLNVMSLKGGDGLERNTSLWMLNDGCSFEGIISERTSPFFIPVLESVEAKEETDRMKLTFKGLLFVPCNLSFRVVKRKGEKKEVKNYDFDTYGFLSEREVEGSVGKDLISNCGNEIEVSVHVLFGNAESPSSTNSFILKNANETKTNKNERIVEGGKEGKSIWLLVVIVQVVTLFIVLIGFIMFVVRRRKQKRRTEELEEIVNESVKKDPKAFEMVTMVMSPEEQWRRAEREAEKKNEERIKKRVNDKNLGHSESSEHLLSESGSTGNILGRDSDKIPDWALWKDEEEEDDISRKRTPSPSISSTSTTDTSDAESTFVRGEDLCPTTSSMSNLVDAMACSSPHEKLIVDLRDSLFMLLHGRNEKKEMAIGTLVEREVTGAHLLFWVVHGALHSFDEMENPLQSLANLSPHIVLFSEQMIITVAMHSDCSSSSDDSDSSSISSSTIITSSSDISLMSRRGRDSPPPSSAFEDDEDNRYECLRWKAPELLNGIKKHATKKTVAFSIGMMLWECLTLNVPFGEYEAETVGEKIKNGESAVVELRKLWRAHTECGRKGYDDGCELCIVQAHSIGHSFFG